MKLLIVALLFILPMIRMEIDDKQRESNYGRMLSKTFSNPEELKKYVAERNEEKKSIAKRFNISNMHELVWDEGLTKAAKAATEGCPKQPKHGTNYRQRNDEADTKDYRRYNLFKDHSIREGNDVAFDELFLPLQSRFGCAVTRCNKLMCHIGPHSEWKYADFKEGLPGTGCPGAKTEDGLLCKAPAPVVATGAMTSNSGGAATPTILAGISLVSLLF